MRIIATGMDHAEVDTLFARNNMRESVEEKKMAKTVMVRETASRDWGAGMTVAQRATMRKVLFRLVPFLCVLYLIAYLDRVNIGFAALRMNSDLGLSAAAYGAGASFFFVGYLLFEVPSNMVMVKVGARRWIARIMVTWGIISMAMAFVGGEKASIPCASCLEWPRPASSQQ
jgi:hypothetical protein